MRKLVIDRFEGPYAICEDENKNMIKVMKFAIPKDAKEGSVMGYREGTWTLLAEETLKRNKSIEKLKNDLWN